MHLGDSSDGVGNERVFGAPYRRRAHDDAGMRTVALHSVGAEHPEIVGVTRHQSALLGGGVIELFLIGDLYEADLVSTGGIEASVAKKLRDDWREVFVEVDLHDEGAAASSLSAIRSSISSRHRP